jgi:Na+/proline symporter
LSKERFYLEGIKMLGVDWIDWAVIIGYLLLVTIVGVWSIRRVKSTASFFISDRKYGKVLLMFFTFGAGTHSDQAVNVASKTFKSGISGIWYEWLWLFCTPFFWLLAPAFRRMRAVTTGDFFAVRYNRTVSFIYSLVAMTQQMVVMGLMLLSSAKMITAVSNNQINPRIAILAMTVVFVTYSMAGGLGAAIVTNFVQGILTVVFSFMILPFSLKIVGGLDGLRQVLHSDMFEIVAPTTKGITAFYITIISLNALIGWVTQPATMGMSGAGRTEMEGRVGVMCGIFIKRICTIAWAMTALCAAGYYFGRKNVDPDLAFGLMAGEVLPTVGRGLIGLFIASMFASVMSTCNAVMVSSAGLLTENIYKPLVAPNKPDRHYTMVGRFFSLLIVVFGILFAYRFKTVFQGMELFWKVCGLMGIAFFLGLFWRRATSAGALAGTFAAFAALLFTSEITAFGRTFWNFNEHFANILPSFMVVDGKLYLPWQLIFYLVVGFIAGVVVSLLTKPAAKERLDKFYECIRTPITPNEPETEPFTLPPGVEPAPRNVLIKHPDFEIPKPSITSIVGFLSGWAGVGALIWVFYLIMHG